MKGKANSQISLHVRFWMCVKKTDLIAGCVFGGLITDPDLSLRECSCVLI